MRRRILYILANAELGGAERITLLMVKHHDRDRFEPVVLFLNPGSLPDVTRGMQIATHVLGGRLRLRNPLQVARAVQRCRRIILEERIDLVHACMSYSHIIGASAALLARRPRMLFQHGPVGGWIDRVASLLPATQVFANCLHTMRCQQRISLRKWPLAVVEYATDFSLDPETVERLRERTNEQWGLAPDALVLGILARFDPWKGIDVALRAAAPVLRERPDVRFLVIGGQYRNFHPGYGAILRQIAREEAIERQVVFTGFQGDVLPLLARLDVVIHASTSPEPFGLVILEGMAAGRPVIASRAGGPLEIITEGVDGLFHEPGDRQGLEDCIRRLVESRELRERLGAGGLSTVARRFTPQAMVGSLESHYERALRAEIP